MKNNEIDKTQTFKCYFFSKPNVNSHDLKIKNQQNHQKWYKVALSLSLLRKVFFKKCLENVREFVNFFSKSQV